MQAILVILYSIRFIIALIALKRPEVSRLSFFIQTSIRLVQSLVIVDIKFAEFYINAYMQSLLIDFALTYFYWWPSFACSLIPFFSFHIVGFSVRQEQVMKVLVVVMINFLHHAIALICIHWVFKNLNKMYSEPKQSRHPDSW